MSDTRSIGHTTGRVMLKTGWPTQNGLHLSYVLALDDVVLVWLVFALFVCEKVHEAGLVVYLRGARGRGTA